MCVILRGDSYWSHQCPGLSANDQPYLYVYSEDDYHGEPLFITNASVPDLGSLQTGRSSTDYFNDKAAAIRLRGKWRVCTGRDYTGECADLSSSDWKSELKIPSTRRELGEEFSRSITSVKLVSCEEF